MRPAVGASCAPVPESNSTSLPLDLIAVTVKGIGTCASVRPAAFSAALVSSSVAFLMNFSVVRLLPDAVVHLDDLDVADLEFDDVLVAAFCANAGVKNSSGPSRPNAAPAAAAEITKPAS